MRIALLILAIPAAVLAAPPANDHFAARLTLTGTVPTTTGTNVEATEEPGEDLRNGLFAATVWWKWTAPATDWVRITTAGSSFDTVLQISTGTTVDAQTLVAFNDQAPASGGAATSSVTFMATQGTEYNIAVGGWDFFGAETGDIMLRITQSLSVMPPYFPATLTFSPSPVDVTAAAVQVTASFTIHASTSGITGVAGAGFGWEDSGGDGEFIGPPVSWEGSQPNTVRQQVFTAPRYVEPGPKTVWFKVVPASGPALIFSGPEGGSGYALPPAAAQSVTVVNSGPSDVEAPLLTSFSIAPLNVDVTAAPATLQISAVLSDTPAGVQSVEVELNPNNGVRKLLALLTLSSGTPQAGTWTGSIDVPQNYPTANYAVLVRATDVALNDHTWGTFGSTEMPGGDLDVAIIGGGAYEKWAYSSWFDPGDPLAAPEDDANGDGVPNLLCYAFGMDPFVSAASTGALPLVELTGTGAARKLRLTWLRRKASTNSGLTYLPEFGSNTAAVWETVTGGTATSVDGTFERVVVEDTATTGTESTRFGRVKVVYGAQ
jgi:hypothetical protein